ncbi:MAG: YjbQ family protein [Phycisphaerales bacterium]
MRRSGGTRGALHGVRAAHELQSCGSRRTPTRARARSGSVVRSGAAGERSGVHAHGGGRSDDMPSTISAALTAVSLSIPIIGGRLALGTWQGVYLFEHRRSPHTRQVVVHVS